MPRLSPARQDAEGGGSPDRRRPQSVQEPGPPVREGSPRLLSAGYCCAGWNPRGERGTLLVDYFRSDEQFSLAWDQHQARLTAQRLTAGGADFEEIATA